jgi:Ribbon-helix-helix protein, copG family
VTGRTNKLKEQLARVSEQRDGGPAVANPPPAASAPGAAEEAVAQADQPERRRRPRTAGRRRPAAGESWDERVKRATFYVDRDLLDQLDECCDRHDLNKSEFVREAIIRHLKTYR